MASERIFRNRRLDVKLCGDPVPDGHGGVTITSANGFKWRFPEAEVKEIERQVFWKTILADDFLDDHAG